jgi:hypothetical protein
MSKHDEKKRTPEEAWRAMDDQSAADEAARILALSEEELDGELAAQGFDPAAERARGAELAASLLARRAREAVAQGELDARRARLGKRSARRGRLTRNETLARIEIARLSPRLPERAVLMLRKQKLDEATDEELAALLDELEDLADQGDDAGDGGDGGGGAGTAS